jgi:lipooligosaccharide transport system permease protein
VWVRNFTAYRKYYKVSLIGNLGDPLLYLIAMGYGLGAFLGRMDGMPYLEYIAPGLILSSVMFSATYECAYGSFLRMIHLRTYDAIIATPVSIEDAIAGDVLWGVTKGAISGAIMFAIIAAFGLLKSPLSLLVPLLIIAIGFLFSSLSMFATSLAKNFESFNYFLEFVVTPMFFFSGIFFPLTHFPHWVTTLSWFFPLTHGVRISRTLVYGVSNPALLTDILWILVPTIIFFDVSVILLRRRIIK